MAERRKVNNLLALAILASLIERPMHPYEMAAVLRERGKDQSIKINWGSLYTVVQNLEKHGFIEETETTRQGKRPERTVYRLTEDGREELTDWMRELLGTPHREYSTFAAALSVLGVLPPDEVMHLLNQRASALDVEIASLQAIIAGVRKDVPRFLLIEAEYAIATLAAEAAWVRSLLKELATGELPGMAEWRSFHETGQMSPARAETSPRRTR